MVEIVAGKKTSHTSVKKLKKLYEHIGMRPLIVQKEIEGYISDRLQEALWREALHIINDGVASTDEVDDAIVYGPGLRWAFMGLSNVPFSWWRNWHETYVGTIWSCTETPWTKLKAPELTNKLKKAMVSGTKKQAGKFNIKELEKQRDLFLIEIMKTLNKNQKGKFPNWNKRYNIFK